MLTRRRVLTRRRKAAPKRSRTRGRQTLLTRTPCRICGANLGAGSKFGPNLMILLLPLLLACAALCGARGPREVPHGEIEARSSQRVETLSW